MKPEVMRFILGQFAQCHPSASVSVDGLKRAAERTHGFMGADVDAALGHLHRTGRIFTADRGRTFRVTSINGQGLPRWEKP